MIELVVKDGDADEDGVEIRKRARTTNISKFHYRRSYYDIAFAISITDEILQLEPLEDKLCILKRKYEQSVYHILTLMKMRVSFFSIYNLFDTVEHNHVDNQAQMQKILIHVKRQQNEIDFLRRQLLRFEPLTFLLDDKKLDKVDKMIDQEPNALNPDLYVKKNIFGNAHT